MLGISLEYIHKELSKFGKGKLRRGGRNSKKQQFDGGAN